MKKVKVEFEIMVPETVTPEHLGEWLNFMLDISEDYPQYENPLNLCAFRHVAPSNIKFEM